MAYVSNNLKGYGGLSHTWGLGASPAEAPIPTPITAPTAPTTTATTTTTTPVSFIYPGYSPYGPYGPYGPGYPSYPQPIPQPLPQALPQPAQAAEPGPSIALPLTIPAAPVPRGELKITPQQARLGKIASIVALGLLFI